MKTNSLSRFGLFNPRVLLAFALGSAGLGLAIVSFAAPTPAGWSLVTSPNASNNQLGSVACVSANDCWAIGSGIFIHWNGTSWTTAAMPTSVSNAVLNSVACASTSECWAAGYSSNGGVSQTLIERWDGNSWLVVASPNGTLSRGSQLNGVTCTSASDCWAIGYNIGSPPGTLSQTLVERWDGNSWTIVASPNQPNAGNVLNGVSCASASDCWAVGYSDTGESGDSLFEHWDGTAWSIFASFPPTGVAFTSVSCASASDCWAVTPAGDQFGQPLSAHWNGTTWAIVHMPMPPNPRTQNYLLTPSLARRDRNVGRSVTSTIASPR